MSKKNTGGDSEPPATGMVMNKDASELDVLRPPKAYVPSSIDPKDLLSTGVTTLNLACSGRRKGGIAKGTLVLLAGDSDSGKTWLAKTLLAEAAINPAFDGYRLIHEDPEHGSMMDVARFWPRLADRIEVRHPKTVEEFYYQDADDRTKPEKGRKHVRPYVKVLDSMDALKAQADLDKFAKKKKASETGAEETGSMGTAKSRANSANLPVVTDWVAESRSVLIIIAQLRSNLGGNPFNPKDTVGGLALKFYPHTVIWCSHRETLKKRAAGKDREVGTRVVAKVKKNRLSGSKRAAEFPIYHSHGIDDTGAMIDFLLAEKHWKKKEGVIVAEELGLEGDMDALCQEVEAKGKEKELAVVVTRVWNAVESECMIQRKNRYE